MAFITKRFSTLLYHMVILSTSGLWWKMGKSYGCPFEKTRNIAGRNLNPSYAIIDSQSAKTKGVCEERGFDGDKKIKRRKRHIVVDIMGNLLGIVVHAANIHVFNGPVGMLTIVNPLKLQCQSVSALV